jgi:hypothetical protein
MPYQRASRPQPEQASHESQSFTTTQHPKLTLEEEQDFRLRFPMPYQLARGPQPEQASHETPSFTTTQFPEPGREGEQESSLELPVVSQTTESRRAHENSNGPPSHVSLFSLQLRELALEEEQGHKFVVPLAQTIQRSSSDRKSSEHQSHVTLASIQLPELALEEVEGLELPVVPHPTQSSRCSSASYECHVTQWLAFPRLPEQAKEEKQEFILEFPSSSSDNGHQLHALKNTRDGCLSLSMKKGQRGQVMRSGHGHSKTFGILFLLMVSVMGVVQALTDCLIMHDWLPDIFDGTGTACCEHSGITCSGGAWGRITAMYAV